MSTVTKGAYKNKNDLLPIAEYMKNVSKGYTTAHHIWIENIEDEYVYSLADKVRRNDDILNVLKQRFEGSHIVNVPDCDEIYYSVSPGSANNSDRSLVDCHYDAPFSFLPTFGVRFYRVILACNHNEHVQTTFPKDNIAVTMDTGDFHGLDFSGDKHCVYGTIPKDNYRVLLKLHYIIYPKGMSENAWQVKYVKGLNSWWQHKSREVMRISANPTTPYEHMVANLGNLVRFIYTHLTIFIILLVFIGIWYMLRRLNLK